ncbi:MAG: hydrolase [SAR86 cluster bacterium]|uniref:Hydrolase n=1 Tax=SAR86 cluster bacterium TaxID=2030880 RepID=A0A2A5AXD2_9GAMM|nr:MAG: hydrolase [SAR86 cluster bacterium]
MLIQATHKRFHVMRKLVISVMSVFAILVLASCQPEQEQAQSEDVQEPRTVVDLILSNGKIITVDEAFTIADTVVVNNGLIVEVGDASIIEKYQASTQVDLQGKTLMPGFVDSHTHIRGEPLRFIQLNKVESISEMQRLVRIKADVLGPGEWITGYGWSEDNLAEGRKPTRQDLDAAAPNNPITFTRAGGHSAVVNTLALQLADITDATPDPEGGVIERDEDGVATGVIRERHNIVGQLVPESTYEELFASLEINLNNLLTLGITSITDASKTPEDYTMWEELYAKPGAMLPRSKLQFQWDDPEAIAEIKARVGDGNDYLKIGPIKIFADGGFTGPAAFTKEPYVDQGDYRGYLNMPEEELVALINEVHDAGWQMGIHAIGDAAIELVVDTLADTLTRNPREDHRTYLNHFSMRPSDATMDKMAEHNILITQQPNFTYTLEGRYAANLDGWRLEHNNPIRSPMDHGVFVAISSDILPIGPLVGIYAAVTRKGMSGRVFAAEEAITIEEAVKGYTINSAYINFDENIKGSLEPGKLADMIVLSADILTADAESIMDIEIEQTYIGGALVYEAP